MTQQIRGFADLPEDLCSPPSTQHRKHITASNSSACLWNTLGTHTHVEHAYSFVCVCVCVHAHTHTHTTQERGEGEGERTKCCLFVCLFVKEYKVSTPATL